MSKAAKLKWRSVRSKEALLWAKERIVSPKQSADWDDRTVVMFTDGSAIRVESNYEGDLSEETPGAGLLPPTWEIGE